jgi:hypothetical protein
MPVWQRGYYDHIVRNEADLDRIRDYIANNPAHWALDENNLPNPVGANCGSPDTHLRTNTQTGEPQFAPTNPTHGRATA